MPDYHQYLMRHGEFGVQAIVEMIERNEGVLGTALLPLEERWKALMTSIPAKTTLLAA